MPEWSDSIVSWLALLIAILAWFQGAWLRQRDLALQLDKNLTDLASKLAAVAAAGPTLRSKWRARLAKQNMLYSGVMTLREGQIERLIGDANQLAQQLGDIRREFGFFEFFEADRSMRRYHSLSAACAGVFQINAELEAELDALQVSR